MKKNQHEESEYSHQRSVNLLLDLYPPSNGIRMPGVSQRASRIFIRRARTATEARHANFCLYHIATHYIKPTWRHSLDAGSLSQLSFLIPSLLIQTITIVNPI